MIAKQKNPIKKISIILLLLLVGSAFAQTPFVQSRFSGMPSAEYPIAGECNDCQPSMDGVLEYRLADEELKSSGANTSATYTVQMRVIGGETATKIRTRLAFASARLTYNTDALSNCVYDVAGPFAEEGKVYVYTFNDTTDDSFTITARPPSQTTTASSLVQLSDTFQDFVEVTCSVANSNQDAGIAISGTDITGNAIYVYSDATANNTTFDDRRNIFPLVHNSLNDFRLDGKTRVQNYLRYGDGRGVRLEFSKGIRTQLTAANFTLDATDDSSVMINVEHTPGSAYAEIQFGQDIEDDILRLVSTSTNIVEDVDGGQLADRSFVAALFYDRDAPRVTGSDQNDDFSGPSSRAEWTLTFSSAISPSTVDEDALCVTEENGRCVAEGATSTIPVISVATEGDSPTTLTMVIDQTADLRTGGPQRSIEFRRNAIQGADNFKVVEDYQPALRGVMEIQQDDAGAIITVARVASDGSPASDNLVPAVVDDVNSYVMYFRVTANEDVATLGNTNSYQLEDDGGVVISATPAIHRPVTRQSDGTVDVILRYTVPISSALTSIAYFTLARSNVPESLWDVADNPPVNAGNNPIAAGDVITSDASAQAPRDINGSRITVDPISVMPTSSGLKYTMTFKVSATKAIPTIAQPNSYMVTRNGDGTLMPSRQELTAVSDAMMMNSTITYTVEYRANQYGDPGSNASATGIRATTGWTLNPITSQLLDLDSNEAEIDRNQPATRDRRAPIIAIDGTPSLTLSGNTFNVTFVVMATDEDAVETLDEVASYALYRFGTDTAAAGDLITTSTYEISRNNTQITLTAPVELSPAQITSTTEFRLHRADDDTKLLDASGNLPVSSRGGSDTDPSDDVVIGANEEIDPRKRAVKPSEGARLTVAVVDNVAEDNEVEAMPDANDGNQYTISFTVSADKSIDDLATTSSYTILRRVGVSDDFSTSITVVSADGRDNGSDEATLEFVVRIPDQATTEMTNGFVLARANDADALLDDFLNPPMLVDDPIDVGEAINSAMIARRDTTAPTIGVIGDATTKTEGVYTIEFKVEASEPISSLGTANSYVLLERDSEGVRPFTSTAIDGSIPPKVNDNNTTATITYEVTLADPMNITGFALGRGMDSLRDASNNDPVDPATGETVENGEMLGSSASIEAIAVIATPNPRLAVEALGPEGMEAMPSVDTPRQYTLSFSVQAMNAQGQRVVIPDLADENSYILIRIDTSDDSMDDEVVSGTLDRLSVNDTDNPTTAIVGYTVTLDNPLIEIATVGFTLGRASGRLGDGTNDPVRVDGIPIGDDEPIDTRPDAVARREMEAPPINVQADGDAVPAEGSNGTQYTVAFDVEVQNDEAVRGLGDPSFYNVVSVGGSSNITATPVDGASDSNAANTTATLVYSVTVDAPVGITGFTLVGSNNTLTDNSGNIAVQGSNINMSIAEGVRIDDDANAIATRDDDSPVISLVAGDDGAVLQEGEENTYRMMFTVAVVGEDNGNVPSLNTTSSYQLLRVFRDGSTTAVISNPMVDEPNGNVFTYTATLTDDDLEDTAGFTLARASDANSLLDASGNMPVKSDGTLIATGGVIAVITDEQIDENAIAELSRDASLSNLVLTQSNGDAINLMPNFVSAVTTYTARVLHDVGQVRLATTATIMGATITVNGSSEARSSTTTNITLAAAGTTSTISIIVTAADRTSTQGYTINVGRQAAPSSDATLLSVTFRYEGNEIEQMIGSASTYSVSLVQYATQVEVIPVTKDENVTILRGSGFAGGLEEVSKDEPFIVSIPGTNTVNPQLAIQVRAEDGTLSPRYVFFILRPAASNNARLSLIELEGIRVLNVQDGITDYPITVNNNVNVTTVTAVMTREDQRASITINATDQDVAEDNRVQLREGRTTITIVVTAENRETMIPYRVIITREAAQPELSGDATLSDIDLDGLPEQVSLVADDFDYSLSVDNEFDRTTVTAIATAADVGARVSSITTMPDEALGENNRVALRVGVTTISIVVTAQDPEVTQLYRVAITRAPEVEVLSGVATLSDIDLDGLPEQVSLVADDFDYSLSVDNEFDRTTVTAIATAADVGARVSSITTMPDEALGENNRVALRVGVTTISIVVTAQDPEVTQLYRVAITRAPEVEVLSGDATLSDIDLDGLPEQVSLVADDFDYSLSVDNEFDTTTVTAIATAADVGARVSSITTMPDEALGENNRVALRVGVTTISIVVTAQDPEVTQLYRVAITRAPEVEVLSGDATLSDIDLDGLPEQVSLVADDFDYSLSVDNEFDRTTVTAIATAADVGARVSSITTMPDEALGENNRVALRVGVTTISIVVTAQDPEVTQLYRVAITRAPEVEVLSGDATLSDIDLDGLPEQVSLVADDFDYSLSVDNEFDRTTVTAIATAADVGARVSSITTMPDEALGENNRVALRVGVTTISIVVTAEDPEVTQLYRVAITRAPEVEVLSGDATLSDIDLDGLPEQVSLVADDFDYSLSVDNEFDRTTVTAIATAADVGARVSSITTMPDEALGENNRVALRVGVTTISIVVTAQDPEVTQLYRVAITRAPEVEVLSGDATLSDIDLDGLPEQVSLVADDFDYSLSVDNEFDRTTVTAIATAADVGARVSSITTMPDEALGENNRVALRVGVTTISIVVTAQDPEVTQLYRVAITRAPEVEVLSGDATLSDIDLDGLPEQVSLVADDFDYSLSVDNEFDRTTVTAIATAADVGARVSSITTMPDEALGENNRVALRVGVTTISIVVTAQDPEVTQLYRVAITRAPEVEVLSGDATLSDIDLDGLPEQVSLVADDFDYSLSVDNEFDRTTVTAIATAADVGARVSSITTMPDEALGENNRVALRVGVTTISIVVTAQDPEVTQLYRVAITRAPEVEVLSGDATLSDIDLDGLPEQVSLVADDFDYSLSVDNEFDTTTVTAIATAADVGARVSSITTMPDEALGENNRVALRVGVTTISIVVTAQDPEVTQLYRVAITRAPEVEVLSGDATLSDIDLDGLPEQVSLVADDFDYSLSVDNEFDRTTVTAIATAADVGARVSSITTMPDEALGENNRVALRVGVTTISIVVTAQDPEVTQLYRVAITRAPEVEVLSGDATLSDIDLDGLPEQVSLVADDFDYSLSVDNEFDRTTVTAIATAADVGARVSSITTMPDEALGENNRVALRVGVTTISIVVTAQDPEVTQLYRVAITRAPEVEVLSGDATLSDIDLDGLPEQVSLVADDFDYSLSVDNEFDRTTVTAIATAADVGARVSSITTMPDEALGENNRVALRVGVTTISIVVTAQDPEVTQLYRVAITRAPEVEVLSGDATLSDIDLDGLPEQVSLVADDFDYSLSVDNEFDTTTVTAIATAADVGARVSSITTMPDEALGENNRVALRVGVTTISIVVTAQDPEVTQLYRVAITRAPEVEVLSGDATLSDIDLDGLPEQVSLVADDFDYSLSVDNEFDRTTVTAIATAADVGARVSSITTMPDEALGENNRVALRVGVTTISIVVTAQDPEVTQLYRVAITRAPEVEVLSGDATLSDIDLDGLPEQVSLVADDFDYSLSVDNEFDTTTVTAIATAADVGARVSSITTMPDEALGENNRVALRVGVTTISIVVTAQDPEVTQLYRVAITRAPEVEVLSGDATLSDIDLDGLPEQVSLVADDFDYSLSVDNEFDRTTVTAIATAADVGARVSSITTMPDEALGENNRVALRVGVTTISIVVTAQDPEVTQLYRVAITRAPEVEVLSGDATLSDIDLDGLPEQVSLVADDFDYSLSVDNEFDTTTVTAIATAADVGARVSSITTMPDEALGENNRVTLRVGVTTISIVVTAQDPEVTQLYRVAITRAPEVEVLSGDATLSDIDLDGLPEQVSLVADDFDYSLSVDNEFDRTTVTAIATAADVGARVSNITTMPDEALGENNRVALRVGVTTISIVVTAQDPEVTQLYRVAITRAPEVEVLSGDATLSDIDLDGLPEQVSLVADDFDYSLSVDNEFDTTTVTAIATAADVGARVSSITTMPDEALGENNRVALRVGVTTISIVVTAQDPEVTQLYRVAITRAPEVEVLSGDATLSDIDLDGLPEQVSLVADDFDYSLSVDNEFDRTTVTAIATAADVGARVSSITTMPDEALGENNRVALRVGVTTISIVVTAQDPEVTQLYRVAITRAPEVEVLSRVATLSDIDLDGLPEQVSLVADDFDYSLSVDNEFDRTTVTAIATAADVGARVSSITTMPDEALGENNRVALRVGVTTISIVVTAQDPEVTQLYRVAITRAPEVEVLSGDATLSDIDLDGLPEQVSLVADDFDYSLSVDNEFDRTTVTAIATAADVGARVSSITTMPDEALGENNRVALRVGVTTISIVVTAQDPEVTQLYRVAITRAPEVEVLSGDATLSDIDLDGLPEQVSLVADDFDYSLSVDNEFDRTTVTAIATAADVGARVSSITTMPDEALGENNRVALRVGVTTISIVVTAQDPEVTQLYRVAITRAPEVEVLSGDATLSDIDLDGLPEQVSLVADDFDYSLSVDNEFDRTTVTAIATAADVGARVSSITTMPDEALGENNRVALRVGVTTISIVVTAQDPEVTQLYRVAITRAPEVEVLSGDATLSDIDLDGLPEQVSLVADDFDYSLSVDNEFDRTTVTAIATAADVGARVSSITTMPDEALGENNRVALRVGVTTISIVVTAQDPEVTQLYRVAITRAPEVEVLSGDATLSDIDLDGLPEQVSLVADDFDYSLSVDNEFDRTTVTAIATAADVGARVSSITTMPDEALGENNRVALRVGVTTISIVVTAQDPEVTQLYRVAITRAPEVEVLSGDATLSDIDLDGLPEQVSLVADDFDYSLSVDNEFDRTTVTAIATAADVGARVSSITTMPDEALGENNRVALRVGVTTISIVVTAQDPEVTQLYRVAITRAPEVEVLSGDATLSDIDLDGLPEQVSLVADDFDYSLSVDNEFDTTTVTAIATAADVGARVSSITTMPDEALGENNRVALRVGVTTISIVVTAQDPEVTQLYRVAITRAPEVEVLSGDATLSDIDLDGLPEQVSLVADDFDYSLSVDNEFDRTTVTAIATAADVGARVSSITTMPDEALGENNRVALRVGVTTISIVVTAQDPEVTQLYRVAITRAPEVEVLSGDATLSDIDLDGLPEQVSLVADDFDYSLSVDNEFDRTTVTAIATAADVGARVSSITTMPDEALGENNRVALRVGVTTISIVVTAQDPEVTQLYRVAITRAPEVEVLSGDATLSDIDLDGLPEQVSLVADDFDYSLSVDNEFDTTTVTAIATAADVGARVSSITTMPDEALGENNRVALRVGVTTISIVVTAQDPEVTQLYRVAITRAPEVEVLSGDATLSDIDLDGLPEQVSLVADDFDYSLSVDNEFDRTTVTAIATAADVGARVSSITTMPDEALGENNRVALRVGVTTISIVVTAQDPEVTQLYRVAITRAPEVEVLSGDATLSDIDLDGLPEQVSLVADDFDYSLSVDNEFDRTTVTAIATAADVGARVSSITTMPDEALGENNRVALRVGVTTISIVVTAQDPEVTQLYRVAITRAPEVEVLSGDATLSDIDLDGLPEQVSLVADDFDYSLSVDNEFDTTTVTAIATAADVGARVSSITTMPDEALGENNRVALRVGVTTISIVVTAQDPEVTQLYRVAITRAPEVEVLSGDATLSDIDLDGLPEQVSLVADDFDYSLSVDNEFDRTTVTAIATAADVGARVSSITTMPDEALGENNRVALRVGVTTISIVVTAQDPEVTQLYRVAITRAPEVEVLSGDATLSDIDLDGLPEQVSLVADDFDYSLSVDNEFDTTTVTAIATAADVGARVSSITTMPDEALGENNRVALRVGVTTISIVVTAQDPEVTQLYRVAITRARDTTGAMLTVEVVDKVADDDVVEADPTEGNGNRYTIGFKVTTNEPTISGFATASSYTVLLSREDDETTGVIVDSSRIVDDSVAGTVELEFIVSIVHQEITEMTNGFVLARANALLDDFLNAPMLGSNIIDVGEAIDSSTIARRDTTAPSIEVTGTVNATDTANQYMIVFEVEASEPIPSLGSSNAYVLLQRNTDGDEMPFMSVGTVVPNVGRTEAMITYMVTLLEEDLMNISGFALGRGTDSLRDASNNDPVDPDTREEIENNEVLNSRRTEAIAVIDTANPRLTVEARGMAMPSEDTPGVYTLSFDVEATKVVPDLDEEDSYVLIRIDTSDSMNETTIDAVVESISANDDDMPTTARVEYTVTFDSDSVADEIATFGFTLGRASGELLDEEDNNPVQTDGTAITDDNPRIDDNEAAVARRDTDAPSMRVVATTTQATPSDRGLTYSGSFMVSSMPAEAIRDIDKEDDSYHLIRIPISGDLSIVSTDLKVTAEANADTATIEFSVTLATLEDARNTAAFTLGRVNAPAGEGLRDLSNNALVPAQSESPFRLDMSSNALVQRDTTSPAISVVAGPDGAVLQEGEANTYQMMFTVEVVGEDNGNVPSVTTASSYQLVRVFKEAAGRDPEIINNPSVDPDNNVFTYTATLTDAIDDTAGFTLARGSDVTSLLDASGNMPVRSAGTAIDPGQVIDEEAIARTPLSTVASLANIELTQNDMDNTPIMLNRTFDEDQTTYTASVLFGVEEVVVKPTASNRYATIRLVNNNLDIMSGSTATVGLNTDTITEIEFLVTAEAGGTPTTYTVTITRRLNNDATLESLTLDNINFDFVDDDTSMQMDIITARNNTSKTTVRAEVSDKEGARITGLTINRTAETISDGGVSNIVSRVINLVVGVPAIIEITVTAADSDTEKTYILEIMRAGPGIRLRIKVFLEGPLQ